MKSRRTQRSSAESPIRPRPYDKLADAHHHHQQQQQRGPRCNKRNQFKLIEESPQEEIGAAKSDTPADSSQTTSESHPATDEVQSRSCTGCKQQICDRYLLKVSNKFWHDNCLRCDRCQARLGELGASFFERGNMNLCRQDYFEMFGQRAMCSICDKLIYASEMVMRARQNVYHLECFACQLCGLRFCVGDRFHLFENKIVCRYDYDEHILPIQESIRQNEQQQQQQQHQQEANDLNRNQLSRQAGGSFGENNHLESSASGITTVCHLTVGEPTGDKLVAAAVEAAIRVSDDASNEGMARHLDLDQAQAQTERLELQAEVGVNDSANQSNEDAGSQDRRRVHKSPKDLASGQLSTNGSSQMLSESMNSVASRSND